MSRKRYVSIDIITLFAIVYCFQIGFDVAHNRIIKPEPRQKCSRPPAAEQKSPSAKQL